MADDSNPVLNPVFSRPHYPRAIHSLVMLCLCVVLSSLLAAALLPRGYALAAYGDLIQVALVGAAAGIALWNSVRTKTHVRVFWMLTFVGMTLWTMSNTVWAVYELWLGRPVPDVALIDVLLFVKIVPLTLAVAIGVDRKQDSSLRAFGLLDFSILITYCFYLYAFGVYAYRLLPGAMSIYNFRFNLACASGNQVFLVVAALATVRSKGYWNGIYRMYFLGAACYCLGSLLSNVAIDEGRYYSGSIFDAPLVASLAAFLCGQLLGRNVELNGSDRRDSASQDLASPRSVFLSSHLAMLVVLSTPVIGFWLLSSPLAPPELRSFRLVITLLTILLLILQLSIKQDLLAAGLIGTWKRLSETYVSINRFQTHLTQSEKLEALGKVVAEVANQIKVCMSVILEISSRLISRPDGEARIQSMAGKIGQYAQRTDVLVENMLRFAQETPLQLAPLDVKALVESALHLSRVAKLPKVQVEVVQEGEVPLVRGDSSQLLHVFLQLISNTTDALEECGGGSFSVTIRPVDRQIILEFADSGPGIKEPQRVFEPFYTTKPVGKGTGLGLSTCYGIIQQHEGEITCRNGAEGGAIFSIALPVAPVALQKTEKAGEMISEGAL
jgi:signal transduction histidine kinase